MHMTGFERLLRTLRGLATAYGIYVMIDKDGVYLYYLEDKIDKAYEREVNISITNFIASLKEGENNETKICK